MRIISKWKDYYDTALALGHDEHVTFVRETEEYVGNQIPDEFLFMQTQGYERAVFRDIKSKFIEDVVLTPHTVAFCGKLHRGIILSETPRSSYYREAKHNFFYDLESLEEALSRKGKEGLILLSKKPIVHIGKPSGIRTKAEKYRSAIEHTNLKYRKAVEEYFKTPTTDQYRDFFIERKIAIAASNSAIWNPKYSWSENLKDPSLIVNPVLSNWQFYKVIDAYLAFQELEMFLGGVLAGEDNPMAGISDRDLAEAKGYNCMSFRKDPTKRKIKPCKPGKKKSL